MDTQADKAQPGLTATAHEQLQEIQKLGGFHDRQDAYRLAVAIALAENLAPADASLSRTTYLSIGGLDPENALRNAVLEIRDDHDGRPAALIERLAESGIERIHDHLESGKTIRDLLEKYAPAND